MFERCALRIAWITVAFGIIGLVVYAGMGGIRGTDQYWYAADAETLARDHAVWTNNIFPVAALSPGATLPPPFIHNILSVYLASMPTIFLGGFWAWLSLNLAATFSVAGLIWLTSQRMAAGPAAVLVALAYPLLPLIFWQTAQPLAEASTAFFAALSIYALAVAGTSPLRWLLLVVAVTLLYLSRESYLPLLLIVPVGFFLIRVTERPGGWRPALTPTVLLVVAVAVAVYLAQHFFFEKVNVEFSYTRLLHSAVPGRTDSMFYNFDLSAENLVNRLPFEMELLLLKLRANLAAQFVHFIGPVEAVFCWSLNVLVLVALATLWCCRREPQQRLICLAALAPVGVHLLTIALYQNQFRYVVPAFPGLLIVLAIAIGRWTPSKLFVERHLATIAGILAAVFMLADARLARALHSQGMEEQRIRIAAKKLFEDHLGSDARLVVAYDKGYQLFAYAARPRLVLFFHNRYHAAQARPLLDAFGGEMLLAPDNGRAVKTLQGKPIDGSQEVIAFGNRWRLYRIAEKK